MAMTPANGAAFQNRQVANDISYNTSNTGIQTPYWVKLTGDGNKYIGYVSQDGVSWIAVDSLTIALGSHAYLGLAYTAHNNTIAGIAVVDQVRVKDYQDTLSVRLVSFTGSNVNNQYTQLNWQTGKELDFDHFEVEHGSTTTSFQS